MNGAQLDISSFWHWLGQRFIVDFHIGAGFTAAVDYMTAHFAAFFDGVAAIIEFIAGNLIAFLNFLPAAVIFAVVILIALWRSGWKLALAVFIGLYLLMSMGFWGYSMDTLGLVIGATVVALIVGLPLGVAMAKSEWTNTVVRPILDFMQTLPPFVYLIPAVIFFGTGRIPGTIATFIFCMPPAVRMMNLGIRHVPTENVEAGRAFGCNPLQLLFRVELPLAMPSIMAGINQTIMLALSMVVIASLIGAGGLGNPVVTGLQQLRLGIGFEGGLGVVILAILLDRVTQSFAERSSRAGGLAARFLRVFSRRDAQV
ncbi:proline/glycine betaine ABC transporter permease [Salinisphaera sp. USBA-960]|uniref:ABC transporter permease n=1 Tax=Salinisphaera orenii TaxID=856731 RepID=UPI000DBE4BDF|nr:proline/glycine betaine ABC transporter permease [Salifodinibacter halophilus]NNC25405.1 proline/glycine betaine ABC transporter permease [Salifodinibacter halophilus]